MTETPKGAAVAAPKPPLEERLLEKAQTPREREMAFALASAARQEKMIKAAAAELAETSWGKSISPVARAAVAAYCWEIGADPVRHVFVLGGTIFPNGTFYRDVVAANPEFRWASDPAWFHADARADAAAQAERLALRLEHNIAEDVPAAMLLVLHYVNCPCATCREQHDSDGSGRGPFKGIGRVRATKDPVGAEFPRESAETRAWREAGEKAEPVWFRKHPRLVAAEQIITEARTVARQEAPALTSGEAAVEGDHVPPVVE